MKLSIIVGLSAMAVTTSGVVQLENFDYMGVGWCTLDSSNSLHLSGWKRRTSDEYIDSGLESYITHCAKDAQIAGEDSISGFTVLENGDCFLHPADPNVVIDDNERCPDESLPCPAKSDFGIYSRSRGTEYTWVYAKEGHGGDGEVRHGHIEGVDYHEEHYCYRVPPPTPAPTPFPTVSPTLAPVTPAPTREPSAQPTPAPTPNPTSMPSQEPTPSPTAEQSVTPEPTNGGSDDVPTMKPTLEVVFVKEVETVISGIEEAGLEKTREPMAQASGVLSDNVEIEYNEVTMNEEENPSGTQRRRLSGPSATWEVTYKVTFENEEARNSAPSSKEELQQAFEQELKSVDWGEGHAPVVEVKSVKNRQETHHEHENENTKTEERAGSSKTPKKDSSTLYIWVGGGGGFVLIMLVALCCLCKQNESVKNKTKNDYRKASQDDSRNKINVGSPKSNAAEQRV